MTLHSQSKRFIAELAQNKGPAWHEIPVAKSRELFDGLTPIFGQGPEMHAVEEQVTTDGIGLRIYRPNAATNSPVIVFFHGGGWVLGNIESHDTVCRNLAVASDHTVISVDYRLAPEHKYPAAIDDAFAATQFVSKHAVKLGVDASRLVVAGDSAGGNLAAAVAIKARDEGGPSISKQVLIYPVIEPNFVTDSYLACAENHGLTRTTMQWFWEQYIDGGDLDRKYVCLANAEVSNLPPAFVLTAEYDVLRDEGESYAEHLKAAGVDVSLKRYAGMLHGFIHFAGVFDDALTAIEDIASALNSTRT